MTGLAKENQIFGGWNGFVTLSAESGLARAEGGEVVVLAGCFAPRIILGKDAIEQAACLG